MDKIIIKYEISQELVENEIYIINFEYDKCVHFLSLDNYKSPQNLKEDLSYFDGCDLLVEYKGISKIDGKKVFIVDIISNKRRKKLKNIL